MYYSLYEILFFDRRQNVSGCRECVCTIPKLFLPVVFTHFTYITSCFGFNTCFTRTPTSLFNSYLFNPYCSTHNATVDINILLFCHIRTSVHHHDHSPASHHSAVRPLLFRCRRRVQHHPQLCRHFALVETDVV